jgi:hypothetical protein
VFRPHLVDGDAGVHRLQAHAAALGMEAEQPEGREDPGHPAEDEPAALAGIAPLEVAGARDEVDLGYEAARLVDGEHDHLAAERDDVVGAAAARQPHLRRS